MRHIQIRQPVIEQMNRDLWSVTDAQIDIEIIACAELVL